MKKFFLIVVTLLPTLLVAQNGIQISNFSVSAGTITLDLSWKKVGMPTLWLDSAWVFVDYNNAGVMKRLPLASGATLTATSAPGVGKVIVIPGNTQGVWVVGNARSAGSFTATVKLPFSGSNVSGACAYASNYPPLGKWNNDGTELAITGTPPYLMKIESGTVTKTVQSGSPFLPPAGYTLLSFTDQTGAPGMLHCTPPTAPESLTASSTTVCSGVSVLLTAAGGQDGSNSQFEWGTGTVGTGGTLTSLNTYSVTPTSSITYWVRRVSTDGCGTTAAATRTITVLALPTTTSLTASTTTICNGAAATLTAVGVSAASYSFDNGSTWQTTTTKNVTPIANTTYTLKVLSAASCTSSDSKTATITVTPTNTYTLYSGSTNTSATLSVPIITPIVYNTTGATGCTATGLPGGVTAAYASNQITISGTPSAAGTFNYTVTLTGGCGVVVASGKITVAIPPTPPGAKTTTTWTVNSGTITQVWSDVIRLAVSGCASTTSLSTSNPPPAQYRIGDAAYGYYYNWTCVYSFQTTLCPSPWRVPTKTDFINLDISLGGTGANSQSVNAISRYNSSAWGGNTGGFAGGSTIYSVGAGCNFLSQTENGTTKAFWLAYNSSNAHPQFGENEKWYGVQVRCVR